MKALPLEEQKRFVYLKYRFLPDTIFSLDDVGLLLRKHPDTVKKWCQTGILKHDNFVIEGRCLCSFIIDRNLKTQRNIEWGIEVFPKKINELEAEVEKIVSRLNRLKKDYDIMIGLIPLEEMDSKEAYTHKPDFYPI